MNNHIILQTNKGMMIKMICLRDLTIKKVIIELNSQIKPKETKNWLAGEVTLLRT
jgi:hypothetical protein